MTDNGANAIPEGWRLTYLGQPKDYGWFIAQLAKKDASDFDDLTFVSRTGLTAEAALADALAVLTTRAKQDLGVG